MFAVLPGQQINRISWMSYNTCTALHIVNNTWPFTVDEKVLVAQYENTEFEQPTGILALHHSTFSFSLISHQVQMPKYLHSCQVVDFAPWPVLSRNLKLFLKALLDLSQILRRRPIRSLYIVLNYIIASSPDVTTISIHALHIHSAKYVCPHGTGLATTFHSYSNHLTSCQDNGKSRLQTRPTPRVKGAHPPDYTITSTATATLHPYSVNQMACSFWFGSGRGRQCHPPQERWGFLTTQTELEVVLHVSKSTKCHIKL